MCGPAQARQAPDDLRCPPRLPVGGSFVLVNDHNPVHLSNRPGTKPTPSGVRAAPRWHPRRSRRTQSKTTPGTILVSDDLMSQAELVWENEGGRLRPAPPDGAGEGRNEAPHAQPVQR